MAHRALSSSGGWPMRSFPAGAPPPGVACGTMDKGTEFKNGLGNEGDKTAMYALLDCNSFYASCERIFRPDLADRPVVVLSSNDGCVIAMSREVKRMGIRIGAPYFKCRRQLEREGAAVFSSNFELYGDISARVMDCLRAQFDDAVQVYSIDEAFIELPDLDRGSAQRVLKETRATVERWCGVPVCIGAAGTKTLAKVANHAAKDAMPGGSGIFVIEGERARVRALAGTPVGGVWGVGWRLRRKLEREGLKTALDLSRSVGSKAVASGGVSMSRVIAELNGEPCFFSGSPQRRTVMHTRMFPRKTSDLGFLVDSIRLFTARAAERTREKGLYAGAINAFVVTQPGSGDGRRQSDGRTTILDTPTSDSWELMRVAERMVRSLFQPGKQYRRAGVVLMDLTDSPSGELGLFDRKPGREGLLQGIDALNRRYGSGTVSFGSFKWRPRQAMVSPRYTTRIEDICEVK